MRTLLTSLFLIFIVFLSFKLHATPQSKDLFIYKGDTVEVSPFPLEYYPFIETMRDSLFEEETQWTTANYRGYRAVWTLIDNRLYLTDILPIYGYADKSDLGKLFGARYDGQKVFADWYNGDLYLSLGKIIHKNGEYWFDGVITEQEEKLTIRNGIVTNTTTYDNYAKESQYSRNPELLTEYIYAHINWDSLPLQEHDSIKIIARFNSMNLEQKIDTVKIVKGGPEVYNKELIRVIKSIPEWMTIYRRGKYVAPFYSVRITFSNANRIETNKQEIPFTVAENYFVKNTVKSIDQPKISSQEAFDQIFGMATVMGPNGRPTSINFAKQYVIAVINPTTYYNTTLTPVSLQKNRKGEIIFSYKIEKGEKQTYAVTPALIIIVDNNENGPVILRKIL